MNIVILCPWATDAEHDRAERRRYAQRCVDHASATAENVLPLLDGLLEDINPVQRVLGIAMGKGTIRYWADAVWVYLDDGVGR